VAVGHTLVHNRRTVIYIRRNNTYHRTHKIQNKTYKKYNENNTYDFFRDGNIKIILKVTR
jgi:predicted 2-oxoglutarate/Fe(II)-dependent dioxygenase YbiX